jgi:NAD(P)H-hydrate epimerase
MGEIDAAAPEPVEVLIGRAGGAVARQAIAMLGGCYGRRVVVVAGKGNNGNDGRDAARRLARRGVRAQVVDIDVGSVPACDLVIDAAFGTGLRGTYEWPERHAGTPVLAVDIPSGVDGLTGAAGEGVGHATATVTFAALKPGLVLQPGAEHAGAVTVADIGLDVTRARAAVVEGRDVASWIRPLPATTHKWRTAVWVVGGSPGMAGAAALAAGGAQRAGAGYVRQSSPHGEPAADLPVEVVTTRVDGPHWADAVLADLDRFKALVIGNGLGTDASTASEIRVVVAKSTEPVVVVDADGLTALGRDAADVVGPRTILTPHDGEFARLAGVPPGADRLAAARDLAERLGCVVLLKGGPTVVAAPDGSVLIVTTGDARLATAGTGDVLAGVIGALAARGLAPAQAAAAGAYLHGAAAHLGWRQGFVAGDLLVRLPEAIDRLPSGGTDVEV